MSPALPLLELASQPVALKSLSLSLPLRGEESARAGGTGIHAALPGSSHLRPLYAVFEAEDDVGRPGFGWRDGIRSGLEFRCVEGQKHSQDFLNEARRARAAGPVRTRVQAASSNNSPSALTQRHPSKEFGQGPREQG